MTRHKFERGKDSGGDSKEKKRDSGQYKKREIRENYRKGEASVGEKQEPDTDKPGPKD